MSGIKNKELKRRIIDISYRHRLSHIGSCMTAVDIIDEIYSIKRTDEPFILSAGHAHLAHLVVMEKYGLLNSNIVGTEPTLLEFYLVNYGIHCDRGAGCDVSTGSLGQGLPIAVGMALADRNRNVYCLISDGECAEGSIHEAARIAEQYKLHNLKVYINDNSYGAYQETRGYILPVIAKRIDNFDWEEKTFFKKISFLKGIDAHYHVMNEEEYKLALQILK